MLPMKLFGQIDLLDSPKPTVSLESNSVKATSAHNLPAATLSNTSGIEF